MVHGAVGIFDTIFLARTFTETMRVQGAKWGATADSLQATPSRCQPPSMQLDPTSGDVRTPPDTDRRCLLSSGSRFESCRARAVSWHLTWASCHFRAR
jgi:hypothetical protein